MKTHVKWKTDKKYSQYIYVKRSSYSEHKKRFLQTNRKKVQAKPSKNGKIKLHKRRYMKINKHMNTGLTWPVFRKLQFKTVRRNHWVSTGIKNPKNSKCSEDAE